MSVQRCLQETTSTEFLDWMEYLEQDVNAFHREDYFWATISREIKEVRAMFAKGTKVIKLDQFLLKFTNQKKVEDKKTTKENALEKSKRRWLSWAGIKRKK